MGLLQKIKYNVKLFLILMNKNYTIPHNSNDDVNDLGVEVNRD